MSDTWDDGYVESEEDGHEYADRYLGDPNDGSGMGFSRANDQHFDEDMKELNLSPGPEGQARRIDRGVIEAKFPGLCRACDGPIVINEPITSNVRGGWRHAGCIEKI
jgi:hypothetical protein